MGLIQLEERERERKGAGEVAVRLAMPTCWRQQLCQDSGGGLATSNGGGKEEGREEGERERWK